jgi:hypothetical protein
MVIPPISRWFRCANTDRSSTKKKIRKKRLPLQILHLEERVVPAISIAAPNATYSQTFDGLPNTGTFTLSGTAPYDLNSSPVNATGMGSGDWFIARTTGTPNTFAFNNGQSNTGNAYSYGTTGASDRALGLLASGTFVGRIGAVFVNNTGSSLSQFTISYTGEQWRLGGGAGAVVNTLTFQYGVGATDINTGSFTTASNLSFSSKVSSTGTGGALDGNAAANRTAITATINGLSWANGQSLVIRWNDVNDAGNDDGLAVDDFNFTANMQTMTAAVTANDLIISDSDATGRDNHWTATTDGTSVFITDPNEFFVNPSGVGTVSNNNQTLTIPYSAFSGMIRFQGAGGNDELTVDFSTNNFARTISFDGGTGTDSLKLAGGSFSLGTLNYTNATDGNIALDSNSVAYTNLSPIDMTGTTVTDLVFNLPTGTASGAVLEDDGNAGNSASRFRSALTNFEQTDFADPTNSLTINPDTVFDTLSVNGAPNFDRTLNIGSAGNPFSTITFAAAQSLASGYSLAAFASGQIDFPNATSNLATSGSGSIGLTTAQNISMSSGSSITTVDGALTLSANQQVVPTSGNFIGVNINAASVQVTGLGALTIYGRGGDTMSGGGQHGVVVQGTSGLVQGGTLADATVTGVGGPVPAAGAGGNNGVWLNGTTAQITSIGAPVSVSGTGGGGINTNDGILVSGGTISAGGSASVAASGAGGATGGSDLGIQVSGTITSSSGNVQVTGIAGGSGSNTNNQGVLLSGSGQITAGSSGTVAVTGTGGPSTGGLNFGVTVQAGSITSGGGAVTVTGIEGSGTSPTGIDVRNSGSITTSTNGGNITLIANSINLANTVVTKTADSVTIRQKTNNFGITIGNGSDTYGTGPIALTPTEVGKITTGTLVLGDANSGNLTVNANIVRSSSTNMQLNSGGDVIISGGQVNTAGGNLVLHPGSSKAIKPTKSGVDATANVSFLSNLAINVNGTTVDTQYTQLNINGNVDLNGVNLVLTGSLVPSTGNVFTIVSTTGGTISNAFANLADGATVTLNGVTLQAKYTSTTVTLAVATTTTVATTAPNPTNTSPIPFTVTFSGSVTGFDSSKVTVVNGSVTGFSGSGASYSFGVIPTDQGTVSVSVNANQATDGSDAGNLASNTTSVVYDSVAPSISIGSPSVSITNGGPVTFTVTYADANFNSSALVASNISLNTTGTANGTVSVDNGTGTIRTVTISGITGDGTLGISIAAGTASDTAGNTAPGAGPSNTFAVDNTAPTISISAPSANITGGGPVTFTVSYADANFDTSTLAAANITLNKSGTADGTVSVYNGTGTTRTVTISGITGDGTLGISIAAGTGSDTAGNAAPAAGPSSTFTVDNTAPTISISAPSANITGGSPVTFTVTYADANFNTSTLAVADITLNKTGTADGTVSVDNGTDTSRTVTISGITGDGTLGISIAAGTASDTAGNTAPTAGSSSAFTVDNTAPTIMFTTTPPTNSNGTTALFNYTISDGTTECKLDSGTFAPCSSTTSTLAGLADGSHTFYLQSTDAAGNVGTANYTWTVDTVAPTIMFTTTPPTNSNNTTALFNYTISDGAVECKLDGGTFAACSPSTTTLTGLSDGSHTFYLQSTDAAGNVGSTSYTWTVDTVAPTIMFTTTPPANSNNTTALFNYSISDGTAECKLDNGAFAPCSSTTTTLTGLSDGSHTFYLQSMDAAGNIGTASFTWTIDTVAPTIMFATTPPANSNSTTALFNYTISDGAVECKLDGGTFVACSSMTTTLAGLIDGAHTFYLQSTDAAGNVGTASYTWTVDTVAPTIMFTTTPPTNSNSTTALFNYTISEGTAECKLDSGTFAPCSSTTSTLMGLADGSHTFYLQSTDAAGNIGTASFTWTIDTVAPTIMFTTTPPANSNSTTEVFNYSISDGVVECKLDSGTFAPCSSTTTTLTGLSDGSHTFYLQSTDAAGNAGTASYTWTVDTVAPTIMFATTPPANSNGTTALFNYTISDGTTESKLDSGAFAPCSSTTTTLTGLSDGSHTFYVQSTDAAGNVDSASYTWTVDTVAPTIMFTTTPPANSNSTTALFNYTVSDGAVECKLDGGTFAPCSSMTTTLAGLSDGSHTFYLQSADVAGNVGTANYTWSVDTVAPTIIFTTTPPANSNNTTALFNYTISDGTAECKLDSGTFAPCSSMTTTLTGLSDGSHTFYLQSTDAAGNVGSASYTWTIDTVAPTVILATTATDPTNANPISVTVTFSENVTSFDSSGLTLTNATVANFKGSGANYSFDLVPGGQGSLSVSVPAGVAADAATNPNSASNTLSRVYDSVAPTVLLASPTSDPTNATPIPVSVTFSESVTGFDATDLMVTNSTVSNFAGSGASYSFDLTPASGGTVTASIASGQAFDAAGNGNLASNLFSRTYVHATMTAVIVGNDLVITDADGAKSNNWSISFDGANFLIIDGAEAFGGAPAGGSLSNSFKTLTIPATAFSGHIQFNGAGGDDSLLVDESSNAMPREIDFDGGAGADRLAIKGNGSQNATYTPSGTTYGDGVVAVGSQDVAFTSLSPVDVSGMARVTIASPVAAANSLTVDGGFDSATGLIPAIVVSGTTGLGPTNVEAAHLWNNGTVVLDTSAITGPNSITVSSAVPLGHNNSNLTLITTNDANGSVTANFALAVSGALTIQSPTVYLYADLSAASITGTATNAFVQSTSAQIQDGIDISASGATVHVAAGTFILTSPNIVNKPLTLLGAQYGVDARTRGVVPETIVSNGDGDFQIEADNVTIDGFTLTGVVNDPSMPPYTGLGVAIWSNPGSLASDHGGLQALNNIIRDNIAGIELANDGTFQTKVYHNLFEDNDQPGPNGGTDIEVDFGAVNALIDANKFTNTAFVEDSWALGVQAGGSSITFSNNDVTNQGRGIYAYSTDHLAVTDNTISGATHYAIGLFGNPYGSMTPNSSATISGNTLVNIGKGVYLQSALGAPAYVGGTLTLTGNQYTICGVERSIYNDSEAPINATADTFNGVLASGATLAQQFVIVDSIVDGVDASGAGLVRTKAGSVFVTVNSFDNSVSFATPSTTPKIQRGVDATDNGDTIYVQAGTFADNVVVNKSVEIAGAGQGLTTVVPAQADPQVNADNVTGSLSGTPSNVFLIQADDVILRDLTVDGNNPALTSGIIRGGVDIDARNGIITDHTMGVYNNLSVHDVTVKNVYLRGIYASSGGTFVFDHDTVQNVRGSGASVAMFNFGGSGIFSYNNVSEANDAISANHSTGTQFLHNTITNSDSGIHTDNAGDGGGTPDLIQFNNVSAGTSATSYGIFVFAPYTAVTVDQNQVTDVDVGLGVFGSGGTAVNVALTKNSVDLTGHAGSLGVWVSTTLFGFGSADVKALIDNDNTIQGTGTGIFVEQQSGFTAQATISNNNASIHDNVIGIEVSAGSATITNNHIYDNDIGIQVDNGGSGSLDNINFDGPIANGTDLRLDANAGTVTIGLNNAFAGNTYFIDNRSAQGFDLTGNNTTYKGLNPAVLADDFSIEDKMYHAPDNAASGLIRVVAGHVFVTTPGTGTSDETIQNAVNAATAGDTVNVEAGVFKENVSINKALTLLGANAGVTGAGVRGAESRIVTNGNQNAVVTITSNNVTIDGFFIDGDDPLVAGGTLFSGDDANALYGVKPTSNYSNLLVQNDIIKHVYIGFRGDGAAQGNTITRDWFDSIGNFDFGYAVSLRTNYYADVTNNKMTRVWTGLHTNNFYSAGGPANWMFTGNDVHSYAGGLLYWLQYQNATALTVDNNTFSAEVGAVANNFGLLLVSIQNNLNPSFTNNTLNGFDYAIGLTNVSTSNTITFGATNSISNANLAGAYLTDNLTFNPVGTTDLTSNGYTGPANAIAVNVTGMTIGTSGRGVIAEASRTKAADVNTMATVSGATITGASGLAGADVEGAQASGSLTNTAISGFATGIKEVGGVLAFGAGDTVTNGTAGLMISGANAAIIGNTLNNLSLVTPSANYIVLTSGALAGLEIDGTAVSFDGLNGSTATLAQNFAIEDKITHAVDDASLGFIRVKSGSVFVTPNSGSIQRGVDVATPFNTVFVAAGSYAGGVNINKNVTVRGGTGNPADVVVNAAANGFNVSGASNDVGLQDLSIKTSSVAVSASGVHGLTLDDLQTTRFSSIDNVAFLTYFATNGSDTIVIDGDGGTFSATGFKISFFTNVGHFAAYGRDGSDRFDVTPPPTGGTIISVDGGNPTVAPGDILNYASVDGVATQFPTYITNTTRATVYYYNFETVNIAPTIDVTPPSAVISPVSSPATGEPVLFNVTFNEDVTGFDSSDVVLGGTANPTTAVVTPMDGQHYTISVTGMNSPGTVTVSIPDGAAQDLAGNASLAASSNVTFAPTATTVESLKIDSGGIQRSIIRSLTITFSSHVTLAPGAITLNDTDKGGGPVTLNVSTSDIMGKTVAVVTFSGPFTEFQSLVDGHYALAIHASLVTDAYGQALDGDANGAPGGDYTSNFFRFFGDINGDGAVAANDFVQFRQYFGGYLSAFDFDNDGSVSASDFVQFRRRFGGSI